MVPAEGLLHQSFYHNYHAAGVLRAGSAGLQCVYVCSHNEYMTTLGRVAPFCLEAESQTYSLTLSIERLRCREPHVMRYYVLLHFTSSWSDQTLYSESGARLPGARGPSPL